MSVAIITRSQARALVNRLDLLSDEVALVHRQRITWESRLAQLGESYGTSGGSAADRRRLIEAMAAAERIANGSAHA